MAWIHESPQWPRLRWDAAALAETLPAVRHQQGRLLGRVEGLGLETRTQTNLAALTADVVKSSAIEGEVLAPDEVRSSIARRLGVDAAGLPAPGRAVEGIVEMMLGATQNCAAPLTKEGLLEWHRLLFSGAERRPTTIGAWRPASAGEMRVVSGPVGHERVHFIAPAAGRLDSEMAALLAWFNGAEPVDPVLKAGVAHFWFVTIHPFEDGNGRIGRAIADMALARADGVRERYYSMSSQIEAEGKQYYQRLEAAQRGDVDITAWLLWFLGCLGRAIEAAEQNISSALYEARLWEHLNRGGINDRQRLVIARLLGDFKGFLTTSKYAKLAKCSPDSALRDIRDLVERGALLANPGGGRSASYRLAGPGELPD
jgi:Fic family protein